MATANALELSGIDIAFGGVRALRGADFSARPGEIMGLCGENGAGKSTLIKVLAGVHARERYAGSVRIDGIERELRAPADARDAGVAVVHQELMLVPGLSVAHNLLLGREPRRFGLIDDAALEARARVELSRFGFGDQIDPTRTVAELGVGLQQIVEIIRALSQNGRILVLDEPTAALTGYETDRLLDWLRKLKAGGTTAVYVSHRLDEVFRICDRVSVLRDGRSIATLDIEATTPAEIVSLMVGRSLSTHSRSRSTAPAEGTPLALEVSDFGVYEAPGAPKLAVDGVSFAVRRGEILAVCGAMGSGRTALLSGLFGCARGGSKGQIRVAGAAATITAPDQAIERRLAFVPEDRRGHGLVLGMTVAENLALPSLALPQVMGAWAKLGLVDGYGEASLAERRIRELSIRGAADVAVGTLSGGNQQKVLLGKWLERPPEVLLLDEPTRGVDVGAREEIYGILERLAAEGVAIVFASSELAEVLRLAQRILVLRQGKPVAEIPAASATEEAIVQLATGAV